MLFKIIWRSFLRQRRNYVVYFLCMMLSVMIFYSFCAMAYDQPLTHRAQQDIQIEGVLTLGNVVVAIVVLFFMLSANRFFIQQRQKEIGLYQLFGVRKSRMLSQLAVETTVLNVISLVVGIVMGVVFSKFFAMILIKAMDLNITSRFFISWPSIATTALMLLLAVLLISIQNTWLLWKKQLIDYFQQKNSFSSHRMQITWSNYLIGSISLILIGIGYYIAMNYQEVTMRYIQQTDDMYAFLWIPLFILSACVFGTYLFFGYGIQVILYLSTKWHKFSYRKLRFFVLNNTRQLVYKNWRNFSLIAIILAVAISMIGGAIGLFAVSYRITDLNHPSEFQVTSERTTHLEQLLQQSGGTITNRFVLPLKVTGYFSIEENDFLDTDTFEQVRLIDLVSESDYRRLQESFLEFPDIDIQTSHGAILVQSDLNLNRELTETEKRIALPNQQEVYVEHSFPNFLGNSLLRYGYQTLIVKDELYQQLDGLTYWINYLSAEGYDEERFNQLLLRQLPRDWGNDVSYQYTYQDGELTGEIKLAIGGVNVPSVNRMSRLNYVSRYPDIRSARRQGGIFLYVALFVGIIVLVTTTGTLMVRQFFEISREKVNYQLMLQLGIPKKDLHKSMYRQNAWVFFPTMIVAISHGSFAINMLTKLVQEANYLVAYLFCFMTFFIYTTAYLLTTVISLRILEEKE